MIQVIGKKIAKLITVLVASVMVFCATFVFAGCETKRPEIEMTIEFQEETYELTYKLYRNMYPETVAHYLELIDLKFFDNTVIHDYSTSSSTYTGRGLYGGLYKLDENDPDELVSLDYEGLALKNISVWKDAAKKDALNTLVGEFGKNGYGVENNGLTCTDGSLSTAYFIAEDKSYTSDLLYTSIAEGGKQYKYNSTTSGFFISKGTNSSLNEYFCTFGVLKSQSDKDEFAALTAAIDEYISEKQEADEDYDFTSEKEFDIKGNEYVGESKVTFNVPENEGAIIVKTVRVEKY